MGVAMLKENNTIVKMPYTVSDKGGQDSVNRYLIRNLDRARRLARGDVEEEDKIKETKEMRSIVLVTAPADISPGDIFKDEVDVHALSFCAEKQVVPTNDQLKNFAKSQGLTIPFAKVAPAKKGFVEKLFHAAVGTEVSIEDARNAHVKGTLKAWSAPTANSLAFNLKESDGRLVQYTIANKEPGIKLEDGFVKWFQPE